VRLRASHGKPDILQYNQAIASINIANTSSVAHAKNKDDAMFHTERTGSSQRWYALMLSSEVLAGHHKEQQACGAVGEQTQNHPKGVT